MGVRRKEIQNLGGWSLQKVPKQNNLEAGDEWKEFLWRRRSRAGEVTHAEGGPQSHRYHTDKTPS